ncbi:hypothetical protein Btru_050204 [Bulinus truncatus]|nr:hypothetical protein Btru_050204 [Bulinus truncatus]
MYGMHYGPVFYDLLLRLPTDFNVVSIDTRIKGIKTRNILQQHKKSNQYSSEMNNSKKDVGLRQEFDDGVKSIYSAIIEASALRKEENVKENEDGQTEKRANCNNEKEVQTTAFDLLHQFLEKKKQNRLHAADLLRKFRLKSDDSYDTLLHTAALLSKDYRLVKLLVTACPDSINDARDGSYEGQTALHITIGKGKILSTQAILESTRPDDKEILLRTRATGSVFKNNIMMGEIPLSVAILTFNTDMVKLLLKHGARLEEVNSKNDTIVHTLIKYAQLYPDKSQKVIKMLSYINQKIFDSINILESKNNTEMKKADKNDKKDKSPIQNDNKKSRKKEIQKIIDKRVKKIWFKENNDRMTPLKLTVSMGLIDIFTALMKMRNIFYFPSNYDGSFDSSFYDITEIDHVAQFRYTKQMEMKQVKKEKGCLGKLALKIQLYFKRPYSVIEKLSSLEWKTAHPFVDTEIIKMIIFKRWENYKYIFYAFTAIHMIVILLFTTSAYCRKYVTYTKVCKDSVSSCKQMKLYSKVVPWLLLIYSVSIIWSEIYRWAALRQIWRPGKHHNNTWYHIALVVFTLGLFIDCIMYKQGIDSEDVFVVVLLTGCFFLLFLFKGYEKFSVYTVLFQKVIMGDLLRFGAIICVEFAAFSYAIYIVLRGNSESIEEFSTFENTTLTMFGYMLGLGSLDFLDTVDINNQRLVAVIYVLFILTTYILLINSLIAMMSGTCSEVFKDRMSLAILQKSSVIMFLDGLIFVRYPIHEIPADNCPVRKKRAYMKIRKDEMGKFMNDKPTNDNTQTLHLINKILKHGKKNGASQLAKPTSRKLIDQDDRALIEENQSEFEDPADLIAAHGRQVWLEIDRRDPTS